MLLKISLFLAVATTASANCLSKSRRNVCSLTPEVGRGRANFRGWAYDKNVGKCSIFFFGSAEGAADENRFESESECNQVCRGEVPSFCFEQPQVSTQSTSAKWTYNASIAQCINFRWSGKTGKDINVFNSKHQCELTCKLPDMGPCAKSIGRPCKEGDRLWYYYNHKKESCVKMSPYECPNGQGNAFLSFSDCNQRCGRFIQNKCSMPIQNLTTCHTVTPRYGYNKHTDRCEEFPGCDDGGNSFPTAKQCWETCTMAKKNRCVLEPDIGYAGLLSRYYYDRDQNKCIYKPQLSYVVSGVSNIFYRSWECEEACMSKYKPENEYPY
uniref:Putative salivary kunitz domain protein n=1 Tax=Ixodes ricinus TaxID=34613 RepID=A0A0K8RLG7_IXORI